jgi:hypothetical protein
MRLGNRADKDAAANGQLLPERVAELAGELSEAEDESVRRRLARQIPELASRSGQATMRGLQSGKRAAARRVAPAARRVRPAGDVTARGVQSGRGIAVRGVQSGRGVAVRGAQATGGIARKGVQAGGSATWRGLRTGGQWLSSQVLEMAPKVPIRTLATLRDQHPGLDTEQLADRLIVGASRASAGVGAAVGAAAAVPFIPTVPVEIGVETLALVAIELKLIAELHEVYGMPAPGSPAQRMIAYVGAWAERRGVRVTTSGLALAIGSPLRRKLERRLLVKASQGALALAPLLTGAAAGALIDHHETRKLGNNVRDDLRKRAIAQ